MKTILIITANDPDDKLPLLSQEVKDIQLLLNTAPRHANSFKKPAGVNKKDEEPINQHQGLQYNPLLPQLREQGIYHLWGLDTLL